MTQASTPPARVRLMGGSVDLVTGEEVLRFAAGRIAAGAKAIVANHNAHSLALMRRDPAMRDFYAMADVVEVDSMPLIAWGRLLGLRLEPRHRATYLDWREDFWRMARDGGWRVFYLGGAPGVAEAAAAAIARRWPEARIGVHQGFFDQDTASGENRAVVEAINAFAPDVIFVGLGMPLQERWIAANHAGLRQGVVFSVGGAFDYEAGVQLAPPRWAGRAGLEWLFRFAADPRRLFIRYFVEPWSLLAPAAGDLRRALGQGA
ncbi:MAG TPA: WecB/TagA/CpsF family glycosyltransferase [Caulobacteraceae bacterium]|nr:WecB/TagA/CpsF family glycosyltransferase [Caulobacteraceae bacterium]